MAFGKIIKKLRRSREMTQEELAELLSVSPQAVSRWENDVAMPDISMIPIICNIFEITSDELLGINLKHKEEKIQKIIAEACRIQKETGDFAKSIEILQKGLSLYPDAYSIMAELASAFVCAYVRNQGIEDCNKAIYLCNTILTKCTDSKIRNLAIQNLCYAYKYEGKADELLQLIEDMPEVSFCKEDLLLHSLSGKEAIESIRSYILFCFSRISEGLEKLASIREESKYFFSADDRLKMYEQIAEITKCLFSDKDYNFFAQYGENSCLGMALTYTEIHDVEKAIASLEEAVNFAIHFDTYSENAEHTSPGIRGIVDGGWIMELSGNRSAQMLDDLRRNNCWDYIRDDSRFTKLQEKLTKYAKN